MRMLPCPRYVGNNIVTMQIKHRANLITLGLRKENKSKHRDPDVIKRYRAQKEIENR